MTNIDNIIAEIRNSLKQYDTSGLIDDLSIYDRTYKALRKFGNLITTKMETIIHVSDGKAALPSNFQSLKSAVKVDKSHIETDLSDDVLQSTFFWKERTEQITDWNRCEDCSKEYTEKRIVEKVYLHEKQVNFCYKNPCYLKLNRYTQKDSYARNCLNLKVESPFEISINNETLYANFKEGDIFIEYYGFETDEENKPYIPDTPQSRLETWLTYHLKRMIFEDIWLNSDDTGIEAKIQYLLAQEQAEFSLAMTDIKAATLTYRGFFKLAAENKKRTSVFEYQIV